jgi:2-methylisocitrate lyase-like PEP mutase family enzyme
MEYDAGVLAEKAERLRALHHGDRPLVMPNAWDVASARSVETAGFAAVATTSGGVASSLGYPDGEAIPSDLMFAAVGRIAAAVDVPVTADIEAGYGLPAPELVEGVLHAGAVGINLEDSDRRGDLPLVPTAVHAERVAAVKEAARAARVDIVVNARVDVYVRGVEPALELALERGRAYTDAGADCVFPILVRDEEHIAALVAALGTVNVLWRKGWPSLARLADLGVRRVSFGSGIHRSSIDHLDRVLTSIKDGTFEG